MLQIACKRLEELLLFSQIDKRERVTEEFFAVLEHGQGHLADQVDQRVVWILNWIFRDIINLPEIKKTRTEMDPSCF